MRPSESQGLQIDREPTESVSSSGWAADPAPQPDAPSPAPFVVGQPMNPAAAIQTEDEYAAVAIKENHTVPAVILAAGALGAMALAAFAAPSGAGAGVVLAAVIGVIVSLGFGTLVCTGFGWLVGKMFGADYGTVPVMLLRFGAVTAGYNIVGALLTEAMGIFAIFFMLPVLLILAVWLTAMDFIQAIAFTFIMTVVSFALAMILVGAAAASIM